MLARHEGRRITAEASGNGVDASVIEEAFVVTYANDATFAYPAFSSAQEGVTGKTSRLAYGGCVAERRGHKMFFLQVVRLQVVQKAVANTLRAAVGRGEPIGGRKRATVRC